MQKGRRILVEIARKLITALFFAPLAGAADPALLDFIMPDARVVFGADIAKMSSSPFHSSFNQSVQGANPELQKLMDAAGFNPMRDLQEVLFASPGIGKHPAALLVARGDFNASRLTAFAESSGSKISEFAGVPILSDPEKDSGAFALLDNIILAGTKEQVQAALGRRGRGMILNTQVATKIAALSGRYDAWLVSIAPLATIADHLPADARVQGLTNTEALRQIEHFSVGLGVSADLKLEAEMVMTNSKSAGSFAEGIQMLLGVLQKSSNEEPGIMAALQNLNFGVDQNRVHIGFTVPGAEIEKAIAKAFAPKPKSGPMTAARRPVAELAEPAPPVTQAEPAPATAAEKPLAESPKAGTAVAQTAVGETPVAETPLTETPVQETPVAEAPVPETPVQKAEVSQPEPPQAAPAAPVQAVPVHTPPAPRPAGPIKRSARIPANGEILIQSSPKDMGTVVILGSRK